MHAAQSSNFVSGNLLDNAGVVGVCRHRTICRGGRPCRRVDEYSQLHGEREQTSKTSGLNDTSDATARSRQSITSGDAYTEFTATETNKLRFCGLTHSPIGTDYVDIDFAIKLTDFGIAEVRENNLYKAETPYRTGDVFRISVGGGMVRYAKNGLVFQTSLSAPVYPLVVQAAFISLGGSIENTVLGAGSMKDSAEWTTYQHDAAHTAYCVESNLDAARISKLKESWRFDTGGMVTGTLIVSGGTVYVGS